MTKSFFYRFPVRLIALLIGAILVPLAVLSGVTSYLYYCDGWNQQEFLQTDLCEGRVLERLYRAADTYRWSDTVDFNRWAEAQPDLTNFRFLIRDNDGKVVYSNVADGDRLLASGTYHYGNDWYGPAPQDTIPAETFTAEGYLVPSLSASDEFRWCRDLHEAVQESGPLSLGVCGGAALILVLLFVYFACAAGHKKDGTVGRGWQERLPFDLYLAVMAGLFVLVCWVLSELLGSRYFPYPPMLLLAAACLAACGALVYLAWTSFCVRVKLGIWWRETVIFTLLRLILKVLRAVGRFIARLPAVWLTAVGGLALTVLFTIFAAAEIPVLIFLFGLAITVLLCGIALLLRRLQKGGEVLASGDFETKISTRRLFGPLKRHAENLNAVSDGMALAVEKGLRSERLKTELITNVSHDIKTPLTSIINYVDLLGSDPTPEQQAEYLDVLNRQSAKLKKLIEDLVEASKASTGNLTVERTRCSLNELLTQAVGEYSERLEGAGLSVMTDLPSEELFCFADGSLLGRITDNLLSNIVKYALSGTRVYVTLEKQKSDAVITFRNISRAALNLPAEELMERFVRGDASRSSEGNGLGLSIAGSLCELMGGTMTLTVDGDLFKAALRFPLMA